MDAEQVTRALANLEAAFREDSHRREQQWEAEREETNARHRAEVARIQKNSDDTRALHERSVAASEKLATAMERIADSLASQRTGEGSR